ncbi:hypothetical protein ABZ471_42400 [Streptomyces sp. NPDC005728]
MKSKIAVRAAARLGQGLVPSNSRLMVAKNDSASALAFTVECARSPR